MALEPGFGSEVGRWTGAARLQSSTGGSTSARDSLLCCRLCVCLLSLFINVIILPKAQLLVLANSPRFQWNLHIYHDNLFLAMIGLIDNPSYFDLFTSSIHVMVKSYESLFKLISIFENNSLSIKKIE